MEYQRLIDGMRRFGSTEADVCRHMLGVGREAIRENVILAPWWQPASMPELGSARYLSESDFSAIRVWDIEFPSGGCTYIRTGIGAPVLMDVALALGLTACKRLIFIGSVGSLTLEIGIGDVVVPEYSICGDGASRYLADSLTKDCFGTCARPDAALFETLLRAARNVCAEDGVRCHVGRNFSIDCIFPQYAHIDEILAMGVNTIEMETAAAFAAARVAGVPCAALFSVSDNTVCDKSLVSGRTEEEDQYRRFVRKALFPRILHSALE